jgi:hypothetical protein
LEFVHVVHGFLRDLVGSFETHLRYKLVTWKKLHKESIIQATTTTTSGHHDQMMRNSSGVCASKYQEKCICILIKLVFARGPIA